MGYALLFLLHGMCFLQAFTDGIIRTHASSWPSTHCCVLPSLPPPLLPSTCDPQVMAVAQEMGCGAQLQQLGLGQEEAALPAVAVVAAAPLVVLLQLLAMLTLRCRPRRGGRIGERLAPQSVPNGALGVQLCTQMQLDLLLLLLLRYLDGPTQSY
jgi:hypothetical protein